MTGEEPFKPFQIIRRRDEIVIEKRNEVGRLANMGKARIALGA